MSHIFFTIQKGFPQPPQALRGECYSSLQCLASPDLNANLFPTILGAFALILI